MIKQIKKENKSIRKNYGIFFISKSTIIIEIRTNSTQQRFSKFLQTLSF